MSWTKCINKTALEDSEQEILDSHVQAFRKEGKSKAVAEKLAVTARLDEIQQDMKDVQSAIDKAPKPVVKKETKKPVKRVSIGKTKNGFYSALTKGVEDIKQPTAPVAQWKAMIAKLGQKGVKQEELEWSGVIEWLDDQTGKVAKDDVVNYLRANEVQIEEVEKGGAKGPGLMAKIERLKTSLRLNKITTTASPDGYINGIKVVGGAPEGVGTIYFEDDEIGKDPGIFNNKGELNKKLLKEHLVSDGIISNDVIEKEITELYETVKEARLNVGVDDDIGTRYEDYTLPGGEKYKELLLTLPTESTPAAQAVDSFVQQMKNKYVAGGQWRQKITAAEETKRQELEDALRNEPKSLPFVSAHFAEPNILAHVRFNERTDVDGKKVLFLEEVQSDFHQTGRSKGYKDKRYEKLEARRRQLEKEGGEARNRGETIPENKKQEWVEIMNELQPDKGERAPDAPFKTTWPMLAMKRMLRYAAANGFDSIAWTTGEQQADRYSLSKVINEIEAKKRADGYYDLIISYENSKFNPNPKTGVKESELPNYVGKELAEKIISNENAKKYNFPAHESNVYSGLDLKVGGEGMVAFYDQMLPSKINRYVKKWGGKVGTTEINLTDVDDSSFNKYPVGHPHRQKNLPVVPSINITDEMRKAAMAGQPLFAAKGLKDTAGYKERRTKVVEGITNLVNEMAPQVSVKVSDKLFSEGVGLRLSGAKTTERQEVGGTFDPAKSLVEISLNKGDPTNNAHHEALHVLKEAGLFTKAEWKLLENQSEKKWKKEYEVPDTEEGIAYAFGDWRRGKKNFSGTVTKLFQRVKDFIERLKNVLNGMGFQTVNDVFEKVRSGEVGKRPGKKVVAKKTAETEKRASLFKKKTPVQTPFDEENKRLREEHKTLWDKAKTQLRRQLFPGGLLPDDVFKAKISRDSMFEVTEFDVKHLVGQLEISVKEEYGKHIKDLSDAALKLLSDGLAGNVHKLIKPKTKIALIGMRQYIDNLSKRYSAILMQQAKNEYENQDTTDPAVIEQAAEKFKLIEIITGNIGRYVHRSYQAFDDKNWYKKVPTDVLNDARTFLVDQYIGREETESEAARLAEVTMHEILKNGTAYDNIEGFIKESKLGAKDLSVLKKRKDIAPEIRALLGEHKDPRLNFTKSATKMGRLIWNHVFLSKVMDQGMGVFLFKDKNRPANATTQIAADSAEAYAPMNGLWTFPEIDQAFRDALGTEKMANWYRHVVQINGMIKFGKTILSPTTAMRNWQSAFFFSMANGHFNLTHMTKSLSALREYFLHRGKGGKLAYLRKLKKLGVVYDTPYAGEMMRLLDDTEIIDGLLSGKAKLSARKMLGLAQKFYQFGDDFWKIIGFENEKRLLMKHANMSLLEAEKEAAERIRNTYPTYSMVGKGIQSLRRFLLAGTFVSFPAEIIRTTGNIIKYIAKDMKTPGMRPIALRRAAGFSIAAGFAAATQAISKSWFDVDDDEEEAIRQLAAPWQKNSNLVFIGRDDTGKMRYVDVSFVDPYNYFKRPLTAILRGRPWEETTSSILKELLLPFLGTDIGAGTVFEILSNKKEGTGAPVYTEHDMPERQMKDILSHLRKSLQPGIASNVERTWKAYKGDVSPSGRKYTLNDEAMAWVGWRVSTFDPKVAVYYRTFEFRDAKRDAMKHLYRSMRDPNKVSDSELEDNYETAMKLRARTYKEMGQLVSAARKSGLDVVAIRRILKSAGIAKRDAKALLTGTVPLWRPSIQSLRNTRDKARTLFEDEKFPEELKHRFRFVRKLAMKHNKLLIQERTKALEADDFVPKRPPIQKYKNIKP